MSQSFSGKVAVITGGNSGMGLETARQLAAAGAKVVITGRRQKNLDEAVKLIGHDALGVQGDVGNLADLDKLFAAVKAKHGHIDILFANAGLGRLAPIGQVTEADFDLQFNTNVKGLFFTVQKALPLLKDGASVILNASIVATKGMPNFSVYSATKAAVRNLARTLTTDLKDRKIRVNAMSPGPIETPIFEASGISKEDADGFKAGMATQVPLGRIGTASEIAKAVMFLASDDSSYITGINLTVDGGMAQI